MHSICIMPCMVEYIVETLPKLNLDNVCNEFMFTTRAYIVGEFALYIMVRKRPVVMVLLTSHALLLFDVSTPSFDNFM